MTEKLSSRSFSNNAVSAAAIVDAAVTAEKLDLSTITLDKLDSNVISRLSSSVKIQTIFNPAGTANIAGGETVWIYGLGFTPNSVVYVDKIGCLTTFVDAYKIYFTTPPAEIGSYTVYVENYDGTVGSRINGITYASPVAVTWLSPTVLPTATTGSDYSYQLLANGIGTVTYQIKPNAPSPLYGLVLNSNGLITGTSLWISSENVIIWPANANLVFRATAIDSQGNQADKEFYIPLSGGAVIVNQLPQPNSLKNVIGSVGGETVWLTGSGFKLNANVVVGSTVYSAVISNSNYLSFTTVNTNPGSYAVRVNNSDGTYSTNKFTLSFAFRPNYITTLANITTFDEESNVFNYISVNAVNTITYTITSGSLPNGLTFYNNSGLIAGRLSSDSGGSYQFTVSATSIEEFVLGSRSFIINVLPVVRISSIIYPHTGAANIGGNQIAFVRGNNYSLTSTVIIDGIAQNTTFINSTTLQFTTPSRPVGNSNISIGSVISGLLSLTSNGIYTLTTPTTISNSEVRMWGAGGGRVSTWSGTGGAGGFSTGYITFEAGITYNLVVGQTGRQIASGTIIGGGGLSGGLGSGGGGGFSGIFSNTISQLDALIIAGGGGGQGLNGYGGAGGGTSGQDGYVTTSFCGLGGPAWGGLGGNQTSGGGTTVNDCPGSGGLGDLGSALKGGNAWVGFGPGGKPGGGGGGYYGGGGGSGQGTQVSGGGGGSGYINVNLVSDGYTLTGGQTATPNRSDSLRGTAGNQDTDGAILLFNIPDSVRAAFGSQSNTFITTGNLNFRYSSPPNWITSTGNIGVGIEESTFNSNIRGNSDSSVTYSIFSGSLPPLLSLNASNGTITGTLSSVTSVGYWPFTAVITDVENQTAFRDFNITVLAVPKLTSIVYPTVSPVLKTTISQNVGLFGSNFVNGSTVFIANISQTTVFVNSNFLTFTTNNKTPSGTLSLAVRLPSQIFSTSNLTIRFSPIISWISTGNLAVYGFVNTNTPEIFTTRVAAISQSPVTYSIVGSLPTNIQFFSNGFIIGTANTVSSSTVASFLNHYLFDQDLYYESSLIPTFFTARATNTDSEEITANFTMLFVERPTITNVRTIIGGNISDLTIAHSDGSDTMFISGTNFRAKAKLYVGNSLVFSPIFTSTSCQFVAPAGPAGNVSITVLNDDGSRASSFITYIDSPRVASTDNYYTMLSGRTFNANIGASFRSRLPLSYTVQGRFHPNLTLKTFSDTINAYINDYDIVPTSTFLSGIADNLLTGGNIFTLIGTDAYGKTITSNHTIYEINSPIVGSVFLKHYFSPGYNIPTIGNLTVPGNIALETNNSEFSALVVGSYLNDFTTVSIGNSIIDSYTFANSSLMTFNFPNVTSPVTTSLTIRNFDRVLYRANLIYYTSATGNNYYSTPGTYSWTAPANVYYVHAAAVGGGASAGSSPYGPGGGGGGLGWRNFIPVVPGTSYQVVVGSGGSAAPTTAILGIGGANGSNSFFVSNNTLVGGGGLTGGRGGVIASAEILLVGGGGSSGGYSNGGAGGGGGGGGVLFGTATLSLGTAYSVSVGSGATATAAYPGAQGNNTTITLAGTTYTAFGGGGGSNSSSGGSGGGSFQGSTPTRNSPTQTTQSPFTGYGSPGGAGGSGGSGAGAGGGGGGASGAGADGYATFPFGCNGFGGNGGPGFYSTITGANIAYGGGGGGGSEGLCGRGGVGGGGNGWSHCMGSGYGWSSTQPGVANTGGGAGGSGGSGGTNGSGANGGSGVIIIAYPSNQLGNIVTTGTLTFDTNGSRSGYSVVRLLSGTGTVTLDSTFSTVQLEPQLAPGPGGSFLGTGGGNGGSGGLGILFSSGECSGGGGAAGGFQANGSPGGYGGGTSTTNQVTFNTAGLYTWTAPASAAYATVYVWGAGGAGGRVGGWSFGSPGGGGGAARGNISLIPGATYGITVGEGGNYTTGANPTVGAGGGACPTGGDNSYGGGGGGYSGIFLGNVRTADTAIMIAGGGGGGGSSRSGTGNQGGGGGGIIGRDGGSPYDNKPNYRGRGGTQTNAGLNSSTDFVSNEGLQAQLIGGGTRSNSYGGAGGGGWYGGSAGGYSESNTMAGGGGGSGYINPAFVSNGLLFTGSLATAGDSTNGLRGTSGNGGAVATAGTAGAVIIVWTSFIPTVDGISGGGSGGGGGSNPAGNSSGGGSGGGGGGTGLILGQTFTGNSVQVPSGGGIGGSSGNNGTAGTSGAGGPFNGGAGGFPGGGGGGGAKTNSIGGAGAGGAVRLLWGAGVRWPLTNTR